MKKVIEFCSQLDHPTRWANKHGVSAPLVSRIRGGKIRGITVKSANLIIQASGGVLSLDDFESQETTPPESSESSQ